MRLDIWQRKMFSINGKSERQRDAKGQRVTFAMRAGQSWPPSSSQPSLSSASSSQSSPLSLSQQSSMMIPHHHNHCNTQQQQWKAVRHERAACDLCDGNRATFPTVEYSHEYFRPLLFSHRKHRISQLQDYTSTMIFSRVSWVNILSNILIVALAV